MARHIIVIGGGASGTAAAYQLHQRGYQTTILEREDRLGGRIHSVSGGGATFETGAGFIATSYLHTRRFLREVDLSKHLTIRRSHTSIMRRGKPEPFSFLNLLVKRQPLSYHSQIKLLRSTISLANTYAKFDIRKPWDSYPNGSNSLGESLSSRHGRKLVEELIQPVLEGYFYWDADSISEAMWALLLKGLTGQKMTLSVGLQQLPTKLASTSDVVLGEAVQAVERQSDGGYMVTSVGPHGTTERRCDGVICATTPSKIPTIITDLTPQQTLFFSSITYSQTAVLAQVYRGTSNTPSDTAVVYPQVEQDSCVAITIARHQQQTVRKTFAARNQASTLLQLPDDELKLRLNQSHSADLPAPAPLFEYLQRWPEALPEVTPDHLERMRQFAHGEVENQQANLAFAGDYLGGPFIEGAITSGLAAADRLDRRLR